MPHSVKTDWEDANTCSKLYWVFCRTICRKRVYADCSGYDSSDLFWASG